MSTCGGAVLWKAAAGEGDACRQNATLCKVKRRDFCARKCVFHGRQFLEKAGKVLKQSGYYGCGKGGGNCG